GPGKKEGDLEVEQDEQDGDEVVAHVELHARVLESLEAALVGRELLRVRAVHAHQAAHDAARDDRRDTDGEADQDEHQDREIAFKSRRHSLAFHWLVPTERFDLSRLPPPPPQDGVSTNSTTSALHNRQHRRPNTESPTSARPALSSPDRLPAPAARPV